MSNFIKFKNQIINKKYVIRIDKDDAYFDTLGWTYSIVIDVAHSSWDNGNDYIERYDSEKVRDERFIELQKELME